MPRRNSVTITTLVSLGLLVGCQGQLPWQSQAQLALDITPTTLTEPKVFDWTYHRIGGQHVAKQREAHLDRQLLAYPSATNWAGGLNLTTLGCAAGDTVTNGPATVFATKTTPASLGGKVFLLSRQGRLIKVDRTNSADFVSLALGKTCTRTYVTLSPSAARAYVVSDDGTFFVVDTQTMTIKTQVALGAAAVGCAVVYDPYTSDHGGHRDDLYVTDNSGFVTKYTWSGGALSGPTKFPVATTVNPVDGGTAKIEAPPVVIKGVIYVGDQGGGFHMYDTNNAANSASFFTGSPIDTAPAIEIQDGTFNMTTPSGAPKSVARGEPVYAFVAAGATCFWMNLHSLTSVRSKSLYLDDNTPAMTYGYLHNYTYDNSTASVPLSLTDWCAIRTDDNTALAGAAPGMNKTKNWIAAGETDALATDGTAAGGPVVCYMRFSTGTVSSAVVKYAELELTVEQGGWTKLPEFRGADSFLKGTSTVWDFNSLTNANRPDYGATTTSTLLSGAAVNQWGNAQLNPGNRLVWDVSDGFTGGAASDYTLVYLYNQGNKVYWEPGDQNGQNGQKADFVEGTLFRTPAANNAGHRPVFNVKTSIGSFPSPTIETPPVIDAFRKKVYIFYCNALFAIDYSSVAAFEDRNPGAPTTIFNTTRLGRNATIGGVPYAGGAGYAPDGMGRKTKYVNNKTAPVFNYNLTAAYVLDRYPDVPSQTAPTVWDYGLSKFTLPITNTADRLVTSTAPPFFNAVPGSPSNFLVIDPFTNSNTTGGNVFFALGNGRVYQYDR